MKLKMKIRTIFSRLLNFFVTYVVRIYPVDSSMACIGCDVIANGNRFTSKSIRLSKLLQWIIVAICNQCLAHIISSRHLSFCLICHDENEFLSLFTTRLHTCRKWEQGQVLKNSSTCAFEDESDTSHGICCHQTTPCLRFKRLDDDFVQNVSVTHNEVHFFCIFTNISFVFSVISILCLDYFFK